MKTVEFRALYAVMHFRDLEHSAVCISCVGRAEGSIIGGNLEVMEDSEGGSTRAVSPCLIL